MSLSTVDVVVVDDEDDSPTPDSFFISSLRCFIAFSLLTPLTFDICSAKCLSKAANGTMSSALGTAEKPQHSDMKTAEQSLPAGGPNDFQVDHQDGAQSL